MAVEALHGLVDSQADERLWPVNDGRTPGWCSRPISALRSTRERPEDVQTGLHGGEHRGLLDAARAPDLVREPDER
jgi:hypothetical protein